MLVNLLTNNISKDKLDKVKKNMEVISRKYNWDSEASKIYKLLEENDGDNIRTAKNKKNSY